MALFFSILISAIIGLFLYGINPYVAGFIGFGVIVGSLLRAVFLLNKINNHLKQVNDEEIQQD